MGVATDCCRILAWILVAPQFTNCVSVVPVSNNLQTICKDGILASISDPLQFVDDICCPAACGKCGGPGCGSRPGGSSQCCEGTIIESGVGCAKHSAPCIVFNPNVEEHCRFKPSTNKGLTFDLSDLQHSVTSDQARVLKVHDNFGAGRNFNYTYFFSICHTLDPKRVPGLPKACETTWGADHVTRSTASPAFQVRYGYDDGPGGKGSEMCWRLGGPDLASSAQVEWHLYDEQRPALGVTLVYKNGDVCPYDPSAEARQCAGGKYCDRQMRLSLLCNDRSLDVARAVRLEQTPGCAYEVRLDSVYGCPLECARSKAGKVCSERGICGYDYAEQEARCFCDRGYFGPACTNVLPFPIPEAESVEDGCAMGANAIGWWSSLSWLLGVIAGLVLVSLGTYILYAKYARRIYTDFPDSSNAYGTSM